MTKTTKIKPTLADLSARLDQAEARAFAAEGRYGRAEKRFRVLCAALFGAITICVSLPFVSPAVAQGYGITLAQAATRIAALETKTASMSAVTDPNTSQPTVRFTGVNVQVLDGTGATEGAQSGLGNLIIGYNELRNNVNRPDIRMGNHNLVAGVRNNYSGNGGVVFGYDNGISNAEATVTGGFQNTASGSYSSVSGGISNVASRSTSSVSGGYYNTASGYESSVSGGFYNTASESYSNVSGGYGNTASGYASSVSGGVSNMASGSYSNVSGGVLNTAGSDYSCIAGGYYVKQNNEYGFSAGGTYSAAGPGAGTFHSP